MIRLAVHVRSKLSAGIFHRRKSIILTMGLGFMLAGVVQGQPWQFSFDLSGHLAGEAAESASLPRILGQPQQQIVIPGEAASFSVVVADTTGVSYQWFFNSTAIPGATSDALLLSNVGATNEGPYSVVVSNAVGRATSTAAWLFIDSNGSGMPDSWQMKYFGNLNQAALGDYDGDGVSNLQEFLDGTNPTNAASALYHITLFNDGGSVVVVPDQPSYTNGEVVTLMAAVSDAAPFHAWTGDVLTRSNPISVVMTNNKSLQAHFSPIFFLWTNATGGDWNLASNWTPNLAPGSNDSAALVTAVTVTSNTNLDLADFTLGSSQIAPVFTGSGTLTVHGTCLWRAGTMSGSGRTIVGPTGTINFANQLPLLLAGRTLENAGTAVWTGTGPISLNGGVITNEAGALFIVPNPNTMASGGGAPRFDNAGTFVTSPSAGTTTFTGVPFNNYGTAQIQGGTLVLEGGGASTGAFAVSPGATLSFSGAAFTFSAGSTITGAGNLTVGLPTSTMPGTVNVSGTNSFTGAVANLTGNYTCTNNTLLISGAAITFNGTGSVTPAIINLTAGSLGGPQNVTATSAMNWTGGSMAGSGRTIIGSGATLTINNLGNYISIASRTLDNAGTVLWLTGGSLSSQ